MSAGGVPTMPITTLEALAERVGRLVDGALS